jgi:hypothetical protein
VTDLNVRLPDPVAKQPRLPSARHALRRTISTHPRLYLPLARWKSGESVLSAETQLVIDAFPRSANTFAVIAFQLAQNGHVRVAHHMHAPASLMAAAARGVPALVPVRDPEPTIVSGHIREPHITLRQLLKDYATFFESIAPMRDRFVIATFEEVTSDLGSVIRRVNERFGTRFLDFEHSEQNIEIVFALIDERAEGPPWQPSLNRFASGVISVDEYFEATRVHRDARRDTFIVPENRIQRPSPRREAMKSQVQERYRDPALAGLRARAERAFRGFVR